MKLLLIADENNAIAREGEQIVYLSKDLTHFKETTWGQIIFMGRVTFESIGRVLPGRISIVYTSAKLPQEENLYTVSSHRELMDVLKKFPDRTVYLIGGEMLTLLYQDYLTEAIITRVHTHFKGGDQFAPDFKSLPNWILADVSKPVKDGEFSFSIEHWINKNPKEK